MTSSHWALGREHTGGAGRRPVTLVVLDGWGIAPPGPGNPIAGACIPVMSELHRSYPATELIAHGPAVGLGPGQMGNSEVGHLHLGAGRVVYQDLIRIDRAIEKGCFEKKEPLKCLMRRVQRRGGRLHLLGLVSDGGVHSHIRHLRALVEMARRLDFSEVLVHAFTDGRDVPPRSALAYMAELNRILQSAGRGGYRIVTVSGRYYAMDRDQRWDRTERAFGSIVRGEGPRVPTANEAVSAAYARQEGDEFIVPSIIGDEPGYEGWHAEDGAVFFNFRADRARQLTRALVDPVFERFPRDPWSGVVDMVTMTDYFEGSLVPSVFPGQCVERTLGEEVSRAGMRQIRIAETEKYAHVTYFFNGGREEPFPGEERVLVPSPRVDTYDSAPGMSAREVVEACVSALGERPPYRFILVNFANPDMVGHTGDAEACRRAIAVVDGCLGRVIRAVLQQEGIALVTADHGNAECMTDEDGGPHTAHTSNPVPFILVGNEYRGGDGRLLIPGGSLADVAPTVMELLGLTPPASMTGRSLLQRVGQPERGENSII